MFRVVVTLTIILYAKSTKQKSKMGLSHFVTLILYSVYRHARYCGYYN